MRTFTAKEAEIKRDWYVVDAQGQTLGRLASRIAPILKGKHKPIYTPHLDCGDFVIVVNAEKVRLTGRKLDQKEYQRYSGYRGGLKRFSARTMLEQHPDRVILEAVWGMLPKNTLSRKLMTRVRVYRGAEHPHAAQMPVAAAF